MKYLFTLTVCITMSIASDSKIGGVTFFDYTSAKQKSAFNFTRQYLSFANEASENIKYNIVFDVLE